MSDGPAIRTRHGLRNEGAPFHVSGCDLHHPLCTGRSPDDAPGRARGQGVSGSGHAVCACGETSGHLSSGQQRKAWHRQHKAEQ